MASIFGSAAQYSDLVFIYSECLQSVLYTSDDISCLVCVNYAADRSIIYVQSVAKFLVPDWGSKVDNDIGLSYRPDSLCSLAGQYDNPLP
jgi:hypothetical protein